MKKILVCEDEAAIRDFVVINLNRAGYDVVEADCGEAARRHEPTCCGIGMLREAFGLRDELLE